MHITHVRCFSLPSQLMVGGCPLLAEYETLYKCTSFNPYNFGHNSPIKYVYSFIALKNDTGFSCNNEFVYKGLDHLFSVNAGNVHSNIGQ